VTQIVEARATRAILTKMPALLPLVRREWKYGRLAALPIQELDRLLFFTVTLFSGAWSV
jgi:hypothetical protein